MNNHNLNLIMPIYNAENSCERAINSFIRIQRLHKDTTLYIVEDGSTDNTLSKLRKYRNHAQINIITNNTTLGPGLSRMKALNQVKGGHVGFIDADDYINPANYFRAFEDHLSKSCQITTFNALIKSDSKKSYRYDYNRLTANKSLLKKMCAKHELDGSVIFSIYSTKFLSENNVLFGSYFYEDLIFHYKTLLLASNFQILDYVCYIKNNTEGSIVNSLSTRHLNGIFEFIYLLFNLYNNTLSLQFNGWKEDLCYGFRHILANIAIKLDKVPKNNQILMDLKLAFISEITKILKYLPLFDGARSKKDLFLLNFYENSFLRA